MPNRETASTPTNNQLALATSLGRELAQMLADGELNHTLPGADPVTFARQLIAENLRPFRHAEVLSEHAEAAMVSKLDELTTGSKSTEPTAPVKCIQRLPLSTWAFIFAKAVDATEEPGETMPITARVVRGMHYDELMIEFIAAEVPDADERNVYFNEYRDFFFLELAKLPKPDSDLVTEAFSFFGPARPREANG
jgi:hypothetical protein